MRGRWWLAVLLVLALNALRALASASSIDPDWVPGVYDDADYDDVALAVLCLDGVPDHTPPSLDRSVEVVARVVPPAPAERPLAPRPGTASRAPPTA